jgi:hypothetical protein
LIIMQLTSPVLLFIIIGIQGVTLLVLLICLHARKCSAARAIYNAFMKGVELGTEHAQARIDVMLAETPIEKLVSDVVDARTSAVDWRATWQRAADRKTSFQELFADGFINDEIIDTSKYPL